MTARGVSSLGKRSKLWLMAVAVILAAAVVCALLMPRSFALTAISDIVQSLLLISGTAAFLPAAFRNRGRLRLFWFLTASGMALWLSYQLFWTYYEIVLRRDVPDLCAWDIVLFLHFVPLMAALALRPQMPRDEYAARVGRLDFALLLVWWCYLYVLIVMPWQYAVPDVAAYNRNLNGVYNAEKIVFLAALLVCWMTTRHEWRTFYRSMFLASLCYSSGSTLANLALAQKSYYSGSLYDIPLIAAMASLTWIGLRSSTVRPEKEPPKAFTAYGVWFARCSMIAVFSLPLFAAWSMADISIPAPIRTFRLVLTLLAAISMGVMVFVRQQLLDRELVQLLSQSRTAFDKLTRLQAQILQSEKLASIGQLVGGAAHELNNPITAMLGYSDLLLSTPLTAEQRPLVEKIGHYVRRTRSLVASLISFARQSPVPKNPVDLNTLARTAIKLAQPQWEGLQVEIRTDFDPQLPKVLGDSNQLLQVCLQLLGNCLHILTERGGRALTVSTHVRGGVCVLQIATQKLDALPSGARDTENYLALSACQGIVQEHRGQVWRESSPDGSVCLRVDLPAADPSSAKPDQSMLPALWQSRPYA